MTKYTRQINCRLNSLTRLLSLSFIVIMALSACVSRSIALRFDTDQPVNPGVSGQPLPVQVKVFQLRNNIAFINASFSDLWHQSEQVLGTTLLQQQSFTVLPDQRKSFNLRQDPNTQYLAFVAIFRTHKGDTWREIQPVPNFYFLYPKLQITLRANQLHVQAKWF